MREIRDILGRSGREVISIGELGMKAEAEETGETFLKMQRSRRGRSMTG